MRVVRTCVLVGLIPAAAQMQERHPEVARAPTSAVAGVVIDGLTEQPLNEASVELVAVTNPSHLRTARTDQAGRFHFDSVPAGQYMIGFEHPRLDSLLLPQFVQAIEVPEGSALPETRFFTPRARALVEIFCDGTPDSARAGLMIGRLRGQGNALATMSGGGVLKRVRASWGQLRIEETGVHIAEDSSVARFETPSAFVICGLPMDGVVAVQAWMGRDSSAAVDLTVPSHGVLVRDIVIGQSEVGPRLRLTGSVRDSAGAPVARARVATNDRRKETLTNPEGAFVLDGLPGGTQSIEVRALGYLPRRVVVDLVGDTTRPTVFELQRAAPVLSAVSITARRSYAGFETRRQRRPAAVFLDEETIQRRQPWVVADLMRLQLGVRVLPTGSFGPTIMMRSSDRRPCEPTVFVDGEPWLIRTRDLDAFVDIAAVRAMEIYAVPGEVPPEFPTDGLCGAIVIWTRP